MHTPDVIYCMQSCIRVQDEDVRMEELPTMTRLIPIVIVILLVLAAVFFLKRGGKVRPLIPLSSIAFMFILMGIIFSDSSRWFVYGLMGFGIFLAIIDIFMKRKK